MAGEVYRRRRPREAVGLPQGQEGGVERDQREWAGIQPRRRALVRATRFELPVRIRIAARPERVRHKSPLRELGDCD